MNLTSTNSSPLDWKDAIRAAFAPGICALALSGCALPVGLPDDQTPRLIPRPLFAAPVLGAEAPGAAPAASAQAARQTVVTTTPQIPQPSRESTIKPGLATSRQDERADVTLAFDQLPLPSFIQVVFSQILKQNVSLDPAVLTRTDLVTLRTGTPQTPSQVLEITRTLLKSYGLVVNDLGGFYRIVPDSNQSAYLPEIRRGRAQPDVPLPLRPVFNLVEMTAVKNTDVANWLRAMFGNRLNVQEDSSRNALMLSGQSADITSALEAVQVLDQPLMRGRASRLVTPASLGVDDLAKRLVEILGAEGYAAGIGISAALPISMVPIPASNTLLVYAGDEAVLAHVLAWVKKLDSLDNDNRRSGNYFSYEVKYADAQALAKTMQELMSVQSATATDSTQVTPGMRVIGATTQRQPGRIVVSPATNTLIFYTNNADEYAQLLGIMRSLDKPAKSALIEVTVAEVSVGDRYQLGIEWGFGPDAAGSGSVVGGTLGGLGLGTGGFSLSYLNSVAQVRARLNALASANRARILSSPRIMARNGEAATIQVGQEVPIVTSQQSTGANAGVGPGAGVILQQIQYKNTGVILRVKPIIFAGNRVELDVQQEVSSASSTSTGVSISPTFTTRKIETKLSIRDGATVALGGLISSTQTGGRAGIPLLKDIPGVGQLFRTDTNDGDRTELIVLITPYVIESDLVAEQVTQALRSQMGGWAQSEQLPVLPAKATSPLPAAAAAAMEGPALEQPALGGNVAPAAAVQDSIGVAPRQLPPAAAPTVPSGRPVTDAALLEELRRAAAASAPPASAPRSRPARP